MATFKDLKNDWSSLCQNCTDCWTDSDLQLAAELGKTLLERNKELENIIKVHQSTIEEQAQEIEYMKKQSAALREVNDSRLKIYEQLEVSIQDLERANHRLVVENTSDKKLIKSQCLTIENLEARCEELQKKIDELGSQRESLLRQQTATQTPGIAQIQTASWKAAVTPGGSILQSAAPGSPKPLQEPNSEVFSQQQQQQPQQPQQQQIATTIRTNDDEMTDLLRQLQDARNQRAREQKKVAELSQQLSSLLQENAALEEQLNVWRSKAQDVKNLQEEISTLEEVRRGQLCGRCLRGMDSRNHDELSVMLDEEEYDDISVAESLINETQRDADLTLQDTCNKTGIASEIDSNPYRELVEKYQALVEMQRQQNAPRRKNSTPCMSLQEELEMSGEFNSFQNPSYDSELQQQQRQQQQQQQQHQQQQQQSQLQQTQQQQQLQQCQQQQESTKSNISNGGRRGKRENAGKKAFSATPTDFSEAETSSSGFSDETSNKATQTDGRPGSFLCSIADGEDCKFSIYDDNSPFESRFRKTPEYRQLFSEIFSVLKRAAEAKDEGEKLPLLDDSSNTNSSNNAAKQQQLKQQQQQQQDDLPSETTDDNQSVMSSVISSVVSEPPYRMQTPLSTKSNKRNQYNEENNKVDKTNAQNSSRLDYVSINVHVRKKSSAKKNAAKKLSYNDRPKTPDIVPTTNPKFIPPKSNSGGRRRFRPLTVAEQEGTNHWNGNSHYRHSSSSRESPHTGRRSQSYAINATTEQHNSFEYREYKPSTASEEVAKLMRLELSYAEVLRMPNKSKANHHR